MLYDLVEFRFDHEKKAFVKQCTHMTNVPKSLAYGQKLKLAPHVSRFTRFKVLENGKVQYSNKF